MSPDELAQAQIADDRNQHRPDGRRRDRRARRCSANASRVWLNSKNTKRQCSSDRLPATGPTSSCTNAVRTSTPYGSTIEAAEDERETAPAPGAVHAPSRIRRLPPLLPPIDRVTAPAHDRRLRPQQRDRDERAAAATRPRPIRAAAGTGTGSRSSWSSYRCRPAARGSRASRTASSTAGRRSRNPASSAGTTSGSVMSSAVRQVGAPRMAEASSSSPGIASRLLATNVNTYGNVYKRHHEHHAARGKDVDERRGLERLRVRVSA